MDSRPHSDSLKMRVSSVALDPIEKKPLYHFYGGSNILSIGGIGCNMRCPFCQNHHISHPDGTVESDEISPEYAVSLAKSLVSKGNIGIAFTYNEPLLNYEFIRETGILLHKAGLKCVVVTNGCFGEKVLETVLPAVDAFNIDLKGFSQEIYDTLGGDFVRVCRFIEGAVCGGAHVEITSLIVPGLNDSISDMRREASYLAGIDPGLVLHITRCFPRYRMRDIEPTDLSLLHKLCDVAGEYLSNVYLGNC